MTSNTETQVNGYKTETVIARIMDMDVDATGNAERAAWKRYMGYALLAIAKGIDKKKLIEAIFGKGGKASKTFQNMYSMAEKARHTVLGNHSWDEVRQLGIDEALTAVLDMINRHMATLGVSSKNEYDKFCNLSPAEAEAKREAAAASEAEEAAEKAAKAEADKAAKKDAEAEAQGKAAERPDRTPAEAALAALQEASLDDMMAVVAALLGKVDLGTLKAVHRDLGVMIENMTPKAEVLELTANAA